MWLLILAIIALVLFISYFIKIKVNLGEEQENRDDVSKEDTPISVAIANYEQNKAVFISFAQFFLMSKRPYGYKNGIETLSNTKGTISGGVDRGKEGAGSSQGCNTICLNDPSCNAWEYSEGECKKYTISDPGHINITDLTGTSGNGSNIGYIFRPQTDTSWAVSDLSGLPTNHDVFKAIADTVLKLNCREKDLLQRASIVAASVNVKYCYETELTTGNLSDEYITERDKAIQNLEDAAKYFIFTGDSGEYPNKTKYSLSFAILVDVMRDNLYKTNSHLKNAILEAVDELKVYSADYHLVKDFFQRELDKNNNSTVDRQELTDLYREVIQAGGSWSAEIIGSAFSISAAECVNESGISNIVERFFADFDLNGNGLVTLEEILASTAIPTPKYVAQVCSDSGAYNGTTTTTTTTTTTSAGADEDTTTTTTSAGADEDTTTTTTTTAAASSGGSGDTQCNIHEVSDGKQPDWLVQTCGRINEVPGEIRQRFKAKGADINDGYWGMKDACLKNREVSDGKQYGCVWDSDAFELVGPPDKGRDVEKGLANLSDPYNQGPCQRGDECSPVELKNSTLEKLENE